MKYRSGRIILLFLLWPLLTGVLNEAHALTAPVSSFYANLTNHVSGPARVATDAGGNIYVADENARSVTVLDQYGNRLFVIGGNDTPRSVAVDAQKRIYVGYLNNAQQGYVAVFDASGQFQRYLGSGFGEFGSPSDIAVSMSTGRVHVIDSIRNRLKVYDGNGNKVTDFGGQGQRGDCTYSSPASNPGKFDFPSGIAVDDIRQEILVADQNNYRVQIFDMNGNFRTAIGACTQERSFGSWPSSYYQGKFSSIRGLTVDKEGRIYVADAYQGTVQVLERTGTYLAFIGQQGSGGGQLDVPVDVVIDNQKRLIVADWDNNRLSLFQIDSGPAINNLAPSTPVQVSPSHGTQVFTRTPALTVANASDPNGDALLYRFQVGTSTSSGSPVEFTATEGSAYTAGITPTLTDHTLYYWRARAEEAATPEMSHSEWSGWISFYINELNRAPSAPTGLLPAAGSIAKKSTTLSWSTATDPDLYDTVTYSVEISEKADFSAIMLSQDGLGNTGVRIDTITNYSLLKSGTVYYWRVRAIDSHGASSAYSAANGFTWQKTSLQVTSTPSGAKIYLDGNYGYLGAYVGTTGTVPLEVVDIKPGRHVVRVEKAGYFGYYVSVLVADGETKSLSAALMESEAGSRPFTMNLSDESGIVIGEGAPSTVSAKPFVVDWNNDGRKDLLVGDDGGKVYLFENTTTDASPVYRLSQNYPGGVVLTVSTKAAPFVVDWDNDGLKDLVVGCGDGTVRLYLNTASDGAPFFNGFINLSANGSAIQASGNAVPAVVDWNNDNRKDLLVGDGSGKLALFINTGTDAVPAFNNAGQIVQGANIRAGNADMTVTADATPTVVDWNLDGKKDLLVGSSSGLTIYLNSGTDDAPSFTTSTSSYITGAGIAPLVLDYNFDGYSDLLAGMGNGHISYYQFKPDDSAAASATATPPPPKAPVKKKKSGVGKSFRKLFKW